LSLAERLVLCLVAEEPAHCFALAALLAPDGSLGPPRARLHATPEGHRAAQGWLRQAAGHARDVRSELLLKLPLLSRAGADPGP
jgi:hypothetical protein